jgi:sec-independent protein translocase protein TatA
MFGSFGPWELIIILAIALIIFGPGKLPQAGKAIGNAMHEFRNAASAKEEKKSDDYIEDAEI